MYELVQLQKLEVYTSLWEEFLRGSPLTAVWGVQKGLFKPFELWERTWYEYLP